MRHRPEHVCSTPGCPHLTPCPEHGRPADASWSPDRDYKAQSFFRRSVFARSSGRCERCHRADATVAHHVRPGYDPADGLALCDSCHMKLDDKARPTRRSKEW